MPLQAHPSLCHQVGKLLPRTLAPGSKNRARLLKPKRNKITMGELIKRQTDLVVLKRDPNDPTILMVHPAPPEEEPDPHVGNRNWKRGRVRSQVRASRPHSGSRMKIRVRGTGRSGQRRRARAMVRARRPLGARQRMLVRSRLRSKHLGIMSHKVWPDHKPLRSYPDAKPRNIPQPGELPDVDMKNGEVCCPRGDPAGALSSLLCLWTLIHLFLPAICAPLDRGGLSTHRRRLTANCSRLAASLEATNIAGSLSLFPQP